MYIITRQKMSNDNMTIQTTQKVPLKVWQDGSIRVKGSRLLIDMIINAHKRGECPEEIFKAFPSNVYTVADIYSIISYYLKNKPRLEKYLAKREKEAKQIRNKIESEKGYDEKHEEIHRKLQRHKEKNINP